jgi:hypothetical protein
MAPMEKDALLRWKIDRDTELYRFYLDTVVKAAVFLMTVTGAIASYTLSHTGTIISIALIFPALLNGGFALLFYYSITEAKRIADVHEKSSAELGVDAFNMAPLRSVCQIFTLICGVATLGLLFLMGYISLKGL